VTDQVRRLKNARNRKFESISLQQRVTSKPDFKGEGRDHGRGITIRDTEPTQTKRSWTALTPGTFSAATRRAARSRSSVIVPLSTTTQSHSRSPRFARAGAWSCRRWALSGSRRAGQNCCRPGTRNAGDLGHNSAIGRCGQVYGVEHRGEVAGRGVDEQSGAAFYPINDEAVTAAYKRPIGGSSEPAKFEWPALLRKLDRIAPSYKQ
jgi:hypothetical protein